MIRVLLALSLAVLGGCATVPVEQGHDEVAALVEAKAGVDTQWKGGPPDRERVRTLVAGMLQDGITSDEAVRIALVNNPQLQATFEEIGVAQNDMLQQSLLSNPSIGAAIGFPNEAGLAPKLTFSLVQELLDAVMLPARRSLAQAQFRSTVLRVADEALEVVTQTRTRFAELQAAETMLTEWLASIAASEAAAKMARLQFEAGNISQLDLAVEEAAWQQARAEAARGELVLIERREELIRALGLWGLAADFKVAEPLAPLPGEELPTAQLEAKALRQRLDVAAQRQDLQLVDRALALARSSQIIGRVEVGVEGDRESDGLRTVGPSLVLELPIFDQRQALIGGLEAQQRQAERRLEAVAVNARSSVRVARARLLAARALVEHYQRSLLPVKARVLQQSQLQYNAMGISPYQLFQARRDFALARREHIEALAGYWSARAELERAVGGSATQVNP